MKKRLSFITALFLALALMLPTTVLAVPKTNAVANFLQILAAPQITLTQPVSGQFTGGAANTISVSVTSAGSNITSAEFQTFFDDPAGTFVAQEISAQIPISVPAPRVGAGAVATPINLPAGLPATSVVSVTVFGTVTAVNSATGEWQIGTPAVRVYESADTTFLGIPTTGTAVKVEAVRTLATGPLVAKEISRLAGGTLPASPATMHVSPLFNGVIQSVQEPSQSAGIKLGGSTWNISGVPFRTDDANFPAVIGPGIGLGLTTDVTVKFRTLPTGTTSNIALQISSQTSNAIAAPLHPAPQFNTELSPPNLPAGSIRLFVIEGVVSEKNANGEWKIGSQPFSVYESVNTTLSATVPVVGDEVLVIARRTLGAGPLIADSITRQTAGQLTVAPAVIEKTFLFNGIVGTTGATAWTIGGASFVVNNAVSPAVIGSGLTTGSNVTVEFKTNLPPVPENNLWASLSFNPATGGGSATLTPPTVATSRTGFLFLRATDANQQVTTMVVPASLVPPVPPQPPPPTDDGGGVVTFLPQTTTVSLSELTGTLTINSAGVTQNTARLENADGNLALDIPAGTMLKTATGTMVTSITLNVPDTISAAPPGKNVIRVFDLGPNGTTFNPPITITFSYEESALPAGTQENDLVIAFLDGSEWMMLETTVDAAANTVSAQVSHFTVFAILAELPPPTLAITEPAAGDNLTEGNITVSVSVGNFELVAPKDEVIAGQGHLHYYLDVDIPTIPGLPALTETGTYKATFETSAVWENVTPGIHTFGAQLVNNNHTPLEPPVTATVTIEVAETPKATVVTTPPSEPEPVTTSTPESQPTTTTSPAPESVSTTPTPEAESPPSVVNWGLIWIVAAAAVILALALFLVRRRRTEV